MNKILAGVGAALVVGASFMGGIVAAPTQVEYVMSEPVIQQIEIEVPVEVEKIVEVENTDKLEKLFKAVYNNELSEEIMDDVDEDDVEIVLERMVTEEAFKSVAILAVEEDFKDEVDKELVGEVKLDEDDIERVRVEDDFEDLIVEGIDYEDKDARVYVPVKFEQDDIKYEAVMKVKIRDGEVDSMKIEEIGLRD